MTSPPDTPRQDPERPVRRILHLDMDAFFASVEQHDAPELKGKPVIIGNDPRGVVSAASYEARVYGVRSAMPVARARLLCPKGVFLPGRHWRYSEVSRQVMDAVRRFSPLVEQTSVDEAFLDITGSETLFGTPLELARTLKAAILEATGLTCSVGVAPNKYLAKICSDMDKPDGITILPEDEVQEFLAVLPVSKIPGIGPRTQEALARYKIQTAGQIAERPREFWIQRFGDKGGNFLYNRGRGVDSAPVVPFHEPKSSSAENTFSTDTADREVLRTWLLAQAERVARDLRRQGFAGRTVTLKLKYADFEVLTRSLSLKLPVRDTQSIYEAGCRLLEATPLRGKVRLIGLGCSNLCRGGYQLPLLEPEREQRSDRLDAAIDAITERFGERSLVRGRLFNFEGRRRTTDHGADET